MKLVLFLLDAFRADYISEHETPFLYQCSKEGRYIKEIKPSAGFCERTEIFTGLKPEESGFFTAIGFDPINSPYRDDLLLKYFGKIELVLFNWIDTYFPFRSLRFKHFLRKFLIKGYKLAGGKTKKLRFYDIPLSFLPYFNLTEDKYELEDQKFDDIKTIFEVVKEKGNKYFLGSFTSLGKSLNGTDNDRLKIALEAFKNDDFEFTPIYLGKADSDGHLFGPNSTELKQTCKQIDEMLEENVNQFLAIDEKTIFMFLGDHGMSNVTSLINIEKLFTSIARKYKLVSGLDYLYFLDSTMFRVWFLTFKAKDLLKPELKDDETLLKSGIFITNNVAQAYSLPENDRGYGDLTWWANNGVLIFPDFFHRNKPYKGMHGYQPKDFSTFGTCLILGNSIEQKEIKEKYLFEIYDEIKNIIEN